MKSVNIEQTNPNDSDNKSIKKSRKKKHSLKVGKSHAYKLIKVWAKEQGKRIQV